MQGYGLGREAADETAATPPNTLTHTQSNAIIGP